MIDKTILLHPLTMTCVGNMFDETAMLMSTVLVWPTTGCTCGNGGARWSTPPHTENSAMLLMDIHRAGAHGQQIYGGGGKFVMMGEMELFMMLGPGKAPITKRCRDQCSEEDAVRRSSNPSHSNGTNTPGTPVGWMLGSSDNSC